MTLAPYLLALTFGLLISALLHFVLVWPGREPAEDGEAAGKTPGATTTKAPGKTPARAPAPQRRKSRRR